MYINQIDDFIDKMLDNLHQDVDFIKLIRYKWPNFVEHQKEINGFIKSFFNKLDLKVVDSLTNSKRNIVQIHDIIKRYLAYYVFLTIAYHYPGTTKEFSSNLIQYSKLQERSDFVIRNFFDTANNYSIIKYYKLIKDVSSLIMMTPVELAAIDKVMYADAKAFTDDLGQEYVDNYLLQVIDGVVSVNEHNLIKTIVFKLIYQNQERSKVFEILMETEEESQEYTYIDIVVTDVNVYDVNTLSKLFVGKPNPSMMATMLVDMLTTHETVLPTIDENNSNLISMPIIVPIVDNFLRYHQESYRTESEQNNQLPLLENNAQNVREIIQQQKRDKKSDTLVKSVINKMDTIVEYYSPSVKDNPDAKAKIDKMFKNIFQSRKAVIHNYEEEVTIAKRLDNLDKVTSELRANRLEIHEILNNAYFNFRDFKDYGAKVVLESDRSVSVLRYANIEFPNNENLDVHTISPNKTLNLVGLAIPPTTGIPIMCHKRHDLTDIRTLGENGFDTFLDIIRNAYIDSIQFDGRKLVYKHKTHYRKVIYWIYDPEKDTYESEFYETAKTFDMQESIRLMNSVLYGRIIDMLKLRLDELINQSAKLSFLQTFSLLYQFKTRYGIDIDFVEYMNRRQRLIPRIKSSVRSKPYIKPPEFKRQIKENKSLVEIDVVDPTNPKPFTKPIKHRTPDTKSIVCQHEIEWNKIRRMISDVNTFNDAISTFIDKYAAKTLTLDFNCKLCGMVLPIGQYVKGVVYNSETETYTSQYVPDSTPLEEMKGYQAYAPIIQRLDNLIRNRLALITNVNMFTGNDPNIAAHRTLLVKSIIDLIILHSKVNIAKETPPNIREAYFKKHFGVIGAYDELVFFDLESDIDEDTPAGRFKAHTILLYLLLCYIIELNGSQIIHMSFDRLSTVDTWRKLSSRLFEGLRIRTNKTDNETVPITNYPVLCYLIYSFGYMLHRYGVWYVPDSNVNKLNVSVLRSQIHSFVDLVNSIIMDSSRVKDYTYNLISAKLFSHMNREFKNQTIIERLDQYQGKEKPVLEKSRVNYDISIERTPPVRTAWSIPDTYAAPFTYRDYSQSMYRITYNFTDLTTCPNGEMKEFRPRNCTNDIKGINRDDERFHYVILREAKVRRCLTGKLHDFDGPCKICKRPYNDSYTLDEIKKLIANLMKIEPIILKSWPIPKQVDVKVRNQSIAESVDIFIKRISSILNPDADLGYETQFFIDKSVYIIDHTYRGTKKDPPIILDSSKVQFQAKQPHYKMDVYYYADNKEDVVVYYDAKTMRMLGFKPKHKEYVDNDIGGYFLKVNPSVREKFELMAYPSRIVSENINRGHIVKLKQAIDTFSTIISQTKYGNITEEGISAKYRMRDLNIEPFSKWIDIRDYFVYKPVPTSSDALVLNKHGLGAELYTWLVDALIEMIDKNKHQTTISQLFIAIINQIYETNNTDVYKQTRELQEYHYVIYGSMFDRFAKRGYDDDDDTEVDAEEEFNAQQEQEAVDMEAYGEEDEWMNASDS